MPATLGEEVGVANRPDRALSNEHQPPPPLPLLRTPTSEGPPKESEAVVHSEHHHRQWLQWLGLWVAISPPFRPLWLGIHTLVSAHCKADMQPRRGACSMEGQSAGEKE